MTRRKNDKCPRPQQDAGDKRTLNLRTPDLEFQDVNQKTPMKLPKEIVLEQRTPECDFFGSNQEGVQERDPYSPKFIPRIPKLKLDLDIPENDSESEDSDCKSSPAVDSQLNEIEKTQLSVSINISEPGIQDTETEIKQPHPLPISEPVEKNIFEFAAINIERTPQKLREFSDVSLESSIESVSGNFKSSIGSKGKPGNWNGSQILPSMRQLELLKLCTAPKSVPPKLLNGKDPASLRNFDKTQSLLCCNTHFFTPGANKSNSCTGSISPPAKRCRVVLYEVKSESVDPISTKNADASQNRNEHSMKSVDLVKVSNCHFETLEMCINFRQSIFFILTSQTDTPLLTENFNQVLSTIRSENERIISVLSEKVSHLSEELSQMKESSQASLTALITEVNGIRDANKQLAENSTEFLKELKSLHGALENVQSTSKKMSQLPPLPPPPPPPPPPPMQKIKTPTTPRSSRGLRKTPNRKCLSPRLSRPCITVEDLLKVTLKKAPQNSKENRRNIIPGPRGPVVSLDMLRSVKLRSARRRSCDQNIRSPRNRSAFLKNRVNSSLKISPISTASESSLNRILKQVDINRPESKNFSNPTQSDSDLSQANPKALSPFRFNRSHSLVVTRDFD